MGRISRDLFDHIVADAGADSGRSVQILARMGAGRDHPELVGVPETGHLKCWILRVLQNQMRNPNLPEIGSWYDVGRR